MKKIKPLRNALIVLLSVAAAITATELLLGISSVGDGEPVYTQEEFDLQAQENEVLLQMDREKRLFESETASVLFTDAQNTADPRTLAAAAQTDLPDYPLISYMQREEPYDDETVNIAVLGDSFVWGESSLNRNEIFWRLLETSLRDQGYNVRVFGVGYTGANSYDELDWLTDTSLIEDLRPDLVIIAYFYNDPDIGLAGTGAVKNATTSQNFVPDGRASGFIRALSKLTPNIAGRLANYVTAVSMYSSEESFVPIYGVPPVLKGQVYENYKQNFIEPLDAFAAQSDLPIVMMTLPLYRGKVLQRALFRPLHKLCAGTENITLYDSLNDFYAKFASPKHSANYSINIADGHPGSAIQYFYAQYAERFLKKDFSDLLGPADGQKLSRPTPVVNEALPGRAAPECVRRSGNETEWVFNYPSKTKDYSFGDYVFSRYYLTLPLEKDFVALSFDRPVDLSQISLWGDNADNIEIYYRCVNEALSYDDHTVRPFGTKNGDTWTDDTQDRVTTLFIHADCKNDDGARLTMTVTAG
ncbi:MAG: SGNH/GDSL hydrolase family protein [Clostridia bacterium]|nr:SGNH/GDSL hydrolase family protein [Clostridia bacterium]